MAAIYNSVTNYCQGLSTWRMEIQLVLCDHTKKETSQRRVNFFFQVHAVFADDWRTLY